MVVTVNGTGYARGGTSFWADSGDVYTFSYASPLVVTVNAKQYVLMGVDASSPLTVSGATTVTGSYKVHLEGIILAPLSSTNPSGTSHTVTAIVAGPGGPMVGSNVTFRVVSGPNAGLTSSVSTGSNGRASFAYMSSVPGTDTIEASFVNSQGATVTSNQVTKTWTIESPTTVGGKIVPIDTLSVLSVMLSQYSAVIVLLIILIVPLGFLLVKKRNKLQSLIIRLLRARA
jgi:hypothetical protein